MCYRKSPTRNRLPAFLLALSLSLLIVDGSVWAGPKEILWIQSINTDASNIAVDSKGIYVSGRRCVRGLSCEAVIERHFLNGKKGWERRFRILGSTEAFGVAVHHTGIYVAGRTWDSSGPTGFVRRYDADGNLLWTFFTSLPIREGWDVAVDDSGVYFSAATWGIVDRVVVGKLDFSGSEVWLQVLSDVEAAIPSIALHDGTIFVASGVLVRRLDQYGNQLSDLVLPSDLLGGLDTMVVDDSGVYASLRLGQIVKFGFDGTELWRHQIAADSVSQGGILGVDDDGVYFGARSKDGNVDVRGFDKQGNELWRRESVDGRASALAAWGGKVYAAGYSGARLSSNGGVLVALGPVKHYRRIGTYDFANADGASVNDRKQCGPWQKAKFIFPVQIANPDSQPLRGLQFLVRKLGHHPHAVLAGSEWAHRNSRFPVPLVGDYADGVLSPGESVEVPVVVCQRQDWKFEMTLDVFSMIALK